MIHKLRSLLLWRRLEAEMADEMRLHIDMQTELNIEAGMDPREAHCAALREFGNVSSLQQQAREARGWRWLEILAQDGRFAFRQLGKQIGFTLAASLTLALGIGFVTTLFTIVYGAAFRGLPFEESHQIVSVGIPSEILPELAKQQNSCEALALVRSSQVTLSGDIPATRQPAAFVSRNLFDLLRTRPALGRGLLAEDAAPGASKVALIGDGLWRQDFDGDPAVVGREIRIDGAVHTIIGVMSPNFGFPRNESLWLPLADNARAAGALVVGRLNDAVSAELAAEEFERIVQRLSATTIDENTPEDGNRVEVIPFAERGVKGAVRTLLTGILGATFLVLLLACANVANLVLVRAAERGRELALRSALGATRGRLIGQMMTESFALSALGAFLGALGALWGTKFVWNYIGRESQLTGGPPFWVNFEMDGAVLAFVIGLTVIAAMLTGLVPALRASRVDVSQQMKNGSAGSGRLSRLTGILVNTQMALSVCLVVAAGLFLTLLIDTNQKSLPFDPDSVLTAQVSLNPSDFPEPAHLTGFFEEVISSLGSNPEVTAAAATSATSLRPTRRQIGMENATYSHASAMPVVMTETVTPGYFDTMRLQLREGRLLQSTDTPNTQSVAVVNTEFAARFDQGEGVTGRRYRLATGGETNEWVTIVGVVSDIGSMRAAQMTDGPRIYRPLAQEATSTMTLLARGRGQGMALVDAMRRVVANRDPDLPLNKVHTAQQIIEMERIGLNMPGILLVLCGLGALALASVGVYGVVAFSVKARTREFGVRMALGAGRSAVLRLVVGGGLRQLIYGLVAGVALALGASVVFSSLFFGLGRTSYDIWIYAIVITLLTAVGATALLIPARRAANSDPMAALRAE